MARILISFYGRKETINHLHFFFEKDGEISVVILWVWMEQVFSVTSPFFYLLIGLWGKIIVNWKIKGWKFNERSSFISKTLFKGVVITENYRRLSEVLHKTKNKVRKGFQKVKLYEEILCQKILNLKKLKIAFQIHTKTYSKLFLWL